MSHMVHREFHNSGTVLLRKLGCEEEKRKRNSNVRSLEGVLSSSAILIPRKKYGESPVPRKAVKREGKEKGESNENL